MLRAPHRAFQRQLADDRILLDQLAIHLPAAGENAERDRQIERGRVFGELRRGEIPCATRWRKRILRLKLRPAVASRGGNR
jgi:hypothetical protein